MGRTIPTFTNQIEREIASLTRFRQALRGADREAFDRLCDYARLHKTSGGLACKPVPFETMLLLMLIEQEKKIMQLEKTKSKKILQ